MLTNADQADGIARRGFAWLLAHFEQLTPSFSLKHWSRPDRSRVAVAEAAIIAWLAMRLSEGAYESYGAELRHRIQETACPEILQYFHEQPFDWFRPLLATAGALAATGHLWDEAVLNIREHLRSSELDLSLYRPDQVLEMRYWLAKCGLLPGSFYDSISNAVTPVVNTLVRRLAVEDGRIDVDTAYALTHTVFYMRDFGSEITEMPVAANEGIQYVACSAAAAGNIDILAEGVFASWCLGMPPCADYTHLVGLFDEAQKTSGAIRPDLTGTDEIRDATEVEHCYHSTVVTLLACMILQRRHNN